MLMETSKIPLEPIYIVGAGAIGCALAAFLVNAGKRVVLIRRSMDGQIPSTKEIMVGLPDGAELRAVIEVKTFEDLQAIDGIVVITTKSHANQQIAAKLASKGTDHPVVLLQNGLNIEQPFLDQAFTQLYRCVLFVTSQFTADNVISFKPVAPCRVGVIRGDVGLLKSAVAQIDTPGFSFKAEVDIQTLIWRKVIVNCVFNSICPLLNTHNGVFWRNEPALVIARRVIRECAAIARLRGIQLSEEEVTETLLAISKSSDGQLISTLQDINNMRPTEIDTLNLEISRIAAELGADILVTETRLLGELIAIKSSLSMKTFDNEQKD
jgi:2-dehydropantoate 2-reductase